MRYIVAVLILCIFFTANFPVFIEINLLSDSTASVFCYCLRFESQRGIRRWKGFPTYQSGSKRKRDLRNSVGLLFFKFLTTLLWFSHARTKAVRRRPRSLYQPPFPPVHSGHCDIGHLRRIAIIPSIPHN